MTQSPESAIIKDLSSPLDLTPQGRTEKDVDIQAPQCANQFDHLRILPKIATNRTVNLAKSHTDT